MNTNANPSEMSLLDLPYITWEYENPELDGFMTQQELEVLFQWAKRVESVVEVGSWVGRSTHALLSGCPGIVYAVDHFLGNTDERDGVHKLAKEVDVSEIFLRNVGHFPNLKMLKMESTEAAKLFGDKSVDMVFIDGEHTREAVVGDLKAWMPKCRKTLCGHDAGMGGVVEALREMGLKWKMVFPTSLWMVVMEVRKS